MVTQQSTTSASAAAPYISGLAGVNLEVDDLTTYYLWLSIMGLCGCILFVRLAQLLNAHLRHLMNLDASATHQSYWSRDSTWVWPVVKKEVLYAPLNKKRHNREIQLSKAMNVGTLPSRLHTIVLVLYFISNIVYCCMLDYGDSQAALLADVRGRTGHLAVVNMVPLIILAGRNNPLIPLLRVSFDTYNLFHRWFGRIVILQSIAHTAAWAANVVAAEGHHGLSVHLAKSSFLQYGMLATVAFTLILVQSPSAVRHAFYETFLHIHQLLAFLAILGVYVHCKQGLLPQMNYLQWIVAIWVLERSFRMIRILYRNVSTSGCTKATVEALPGDACRVTFELKRPWNVTPGCHVYAYLPSVSLWMSHPFSIAWSDSRPTPYLTLEDEKLPTTQADLGTELPTRTTTSISLITSKRSGMTAKLYNKARASPTGIITIAGVVEGPYGGIESLYSYGTVILFAGGVGITHQISHVRDLLAKYEEGSVATQKIVLVWSVRTTEQLEWIRPWMDEILAMPYRKQVVKIMMFVTKPRDAREVRSRSETVLMYPGRANPKVIIGKEMTTRVGATAVTVCGPGAFADDVRAAVRENIGKGTLDFIEESFTW